MTDLPNRRPIGQRGSNWASALAAGLARNGVAPDLISAISMGIALVGFAAFGLSGISEGAARVVWLLLAALMIQLRLLANMLDGMVALENGKGGPDGPIWNELPDRISDALFLIGAGYGAFAAAPHLGPALGFLCAVLAVLTAHVRELGRGHGFPADYGGPMAKRQRMTALTAAALASSVEGAWGWNGETLMWALALTAALTALTVFLRTRTLARRLREKA
ncbi:MAG: CDP-alcohol phosphatidyltransferase family protein [Caulobacteraceae bacterium]|nr:CDP-alcohol phosphatidyltransferase family protein [Caulobacteraceae bacterium]